MLRREFVGLLGAATATTVNEPVLSQVAQLAQATRFATIPNLSTAKSLGLNVPPSLLRADEVIE